MYQNILKEVNYDQKYLRCIDLQYNYFEVMFSAIASYVVDLVCAQMLKLNLPEMIQVLLPTQTKSIFWNMVR